MTPRSVDDKEMRLESWLRRSHDWTERVLKGSLDPDEAARAVQEIIDRGRIPAAHLFTPVREKFALLRKWNRERKWGLSDEVFTTPEVLAALEQPTVLGPLVVRGFNVTLGSPERTLEEALACLKMRQGEVGGSFWRSERTRLPVSLYDQGDFVTHSITITPVVLDLSANRQVGGVSSASVRKDTAARLLPSFDLLWEAALSPRWPQAFYTEMDGVPVRPVDIAGLSFGAEFVPHLYRSDREVELSGNRPTNAYDRWCVPVRRE